MFPIIGVVVVFGSVIGGYLMHHGNLHVLWQPSEFVIIGGTALGSLVLACPPKLLGKILKSFPKLLSGSKLNKAAYLSLLSLLYDIFSTIRKEGMMAIETHVEKPHESPIFKKYPDVLRNHHAIDFITDNLRVLSIGVQPENLDEMMESELDTHHEEALATPAAITKMADSLPGFGIVAAVLGVVITMEKISEPPEVIGHSVAAALVGTFLGILFCYGLFGPIAAHLEHKIGEDAKYLLAIKTAILSFTKDMPPQIAVEAARRVLFEDVKPSFSELEAAVRKKP